MADFLRAATPMALGLIGLIIGLACLLAPDLNDSKAAAGMGLAGSAITGAAGLAQSSAKESKVRINSEGVETENKEAE